MPNPDQAVVSHTHRFRADIQGLRAVAVGLVVTNHLIERPSGGFVGVDVFFVISGYLITDLLLREYERNGRLSFANFYKRRLKRLGPVALLVAVATVIVAYGLLHELTASAVTIDAIWAILFAANWRMIATGTDYLNADAAASPLQHFWSLSVEEQFYFAWPALLLVSWLVARKWGASPRLASAISAAAIGIGSAGWALFESIEQPTWAYFSTASRAWELAIGALLACCAPLLGALRKHTRSALTWAGLGTIAVSAVILDTASLFPMPGAIIAVLGTAAIIAAGTGTTANGPWVLTNRAAVYLGTISYSLYLWHFPVIAFAKQLMPATGIRYLAVSIFLMTLLAVLSYHWVENPLRASRWRRPAFSHFPKKRLRAASALMAVAVVAVSGWAYADRPASVAPAKADTAGLWFEPGSLAEESRAELIADAAQAQTWPKLSPALTDLGVPSRAPEWVEDGCLGDESGSLPDATENARRCVYGDPDSNRTAILFGDSVAISYAPAIRAALEDDGWRIEIWTVQQCPPLEIETTRRDGSSSDGCHAMRRELVQHVAESSPEVVVVSGDPSAIERLSSGVPASEALAEWEAATRRTVSDLASTAGKVVVLDSPPTAANPLQCATPGSSPVDCLGFLSPRDSSVFQAQRKAVRSLRLPNVHYPNTLSWFCTQDGACPAFAGSTPIRSDATHLSRQGAADLAPLVREAIAVAD